MPATTEEIIEAFLSLTDAQLLALHKIAQRRISRGSSYTEPLDVIHEALHRALDGRRCWPPARVNFVVFMVQTIKSIASNDRALIANQPGRSFSIDDMTGRWQAPSSAPSPEDQLEFFQEVELAQKAADRVKLALAGDGDAQKVLSGMVSGMSPRETCASYNLDSKTFDAARHRVMRRLRPPSALH